MSRRSVDFVATRLAGQHVLARSIAPITVRLDWRSPDPYVVRMSFPRHGQEWLLGRELLDAGLDAPAGTGDVQIRPHGAQVQVRFDVPEGTAVIRLDIAVVAEFLAATFRSVDETTAAQITAAAIDAELATLLSGGEC